MSSRLPISEYKSARECTSFTPFPSRQKYRPSNLLNLKNASTPLDDNIRRLAGTKGLKPLSTLDTDLVNIIDEEMSKIKVELGDVAISMMLSSAIMKDGVDRQLARKGTERLTAVVKAAGHDTKTTSVGVLVQGLYDPYNLASTDAASTSRGLTALPLAVLDHIKD